MNPGAGHRLFLDDAENRSQRAEQGLAPGSIVRTPSATTRIAARPHPGTPPKPSTAHVMSGSLVSGLMTRSADSSWSVGLVGGLADVAATICVCRRVVVIPAQVRLVPFGERDPRLTSEPRRCNAAIVSDGGYRGCGRGLSDETSYQPAAGACFRRACTRVISARVAVRAHP